MEMDRLSLPDIKQVLLQTDDPREAIYNLIMQVNDCCARVHDELYKVLVPDDKLAVRSRFRRGDTAGELISLFDLYIEDGPDSGPLNFTDYVPPGYRFAVAHDDKYRCIPDLKIIAVPESVLRVPEYANKTSNMLPTVLHEIGHAHTLPDISPHQAFFPSLPGKVMYSFANLQRKYIPNKRASEILNEMREVGWDSMELDRMKMPVWFQENLNRVEAQEERSAFAWELETLKSLQARGMNVLGGLLLMGSNKNAYRCVTLP